MFKVLTGEKKRRAISPATLAASVAAHLVLLGGLVYASTGENGTNEVVGPEIVLPDYVDEPREPPPPQPADPAPPPVPTDEPPVEPVPGQTLVLEPPTVVPIGVDPEEPGLKPVDVREYSGIGPVGTVIGTPPDIPTPPAEPAVTPRGPDFVATEDMVEEMPVLDRNGLGRTMERYYPSLLRDSRVSGRVVIELIVEENGQPRAGSVRVLEASHPAFEQATLRAVERFRFRPAKMMGTPVPVRVTIPIQWTAVN